VDVAQVIRRSAVDGDISAERFRRALADLADLASRRYAHDFLLPRIWDLRSNLTAYDAAYVALAEALDASQLTRDGVWPQPPVIMRNSNCSDVILRLRHFVQPTFPKLHRRLSSRGNGWFRQHPFGEEEWRKGIAYRRLHVTLLEMCHGLGTDRQALAHQGARTS
jgi:hypothetical protein